MAKDFVAITGERCKGAGSGSSFDGRHVSEEKYQDAMIDGAVKIPQFVNQLRLDILVLAAYLFGS
jgi:hypothetical protein